MVIIIPPDVRQKIMAEHHIDKSQMSRILHFKVNSNKAMRIRDHILNHTNSLLA